MNKNKVITFGEIMIRFSTPGYSLFVQADNMNLVYGGSEANVAVSIVNLGIPAEHITRFPDNDFGKAATQVLQKYGVITKNILYGDGRIGIYFLENGNMQRSSRVIYDRADSAFANIQPGTVNWDEVMKDAAWFHWTGITPAISQNAATVCLEALKAARKNQVTISADINYRRNLWQYGKNARDVMPGLIALTDVMVAGITDIDNCTGIKGDDYASVCQKMMNAYPHIKKIASTVRGSVSASHNTLSAIMYNGESLLKSKVYELIPIVDRVGAGDAFMAGLIYGWITGKNDQDTLEFATAAGVLKHTIEGDVNLALAADIEKVVRGENVGALLR